MGQLCLQIISLALLLYSSTWVVEAANKCDNTLVDIENLFYLNGKNEEAYKSNFHDSLLVTHGGTFAQKCEYLRSKVKDTSQITCHNRCKVRLQTKPQDDECSLSNIICEANTPYRTADGSCNNLVNPRWGQSNRIQNRLLPNAYDDGKDTPRGGFKGSLPSPRQISNVFHKADELNEELEAKHSLFVMLWGQFTAHDIVLSPINIGKNGKALNCCGKKPDKNCFPITIPDDDNHFQPGGCMSFARSVSRQCEGQRQQINLHTSYIDASMVYGPSEDQQSELRTHEDGKLKMVSNRLPADLNDESCTLNKPLDENNFYCPKAGDERANEQPSLTSLHTLFVREHNFLVTGLKEQNPHWDDERLFQEARKIVAAEIQFITYKEFLPEVLGNKYVKSNGLDIKENGFHDTYNVSEDATIFNSFAVAGLRFGHSLIPRNIGRIDKDYEEVSLEPLQSTFFQPDLYHQDGDQGMEHILRWVTHQPCPLSDRKIEDSATQFLFQDSDNNSFDIASLNIQRGRDHGIPSYNEFRERCYLPRATHFGISTGGLVDHDSSVASKFEQVYSDPDDIDLFTGALTEKHPSDSLVGPTHRCLLALQFKRLKDGDRFFFERPDPLVGFTNGQLKEIKRRYLSSILCQNTDTLNLQKNVFLQTSQTNTREPCTSFAEIDLKEWKEE